jgi:glycosyltransferase involved in cell wall biosynthesis
MIVRNEAAHLPDCLASSADLVQEIVVVDTGSSDRTRDVAADFGARVYDFPWVDSFAAARNESLRYATGDWIFWLDADDRLNEDNRQKLRRLFTQLPDDLVGYVVTYLALNEAGRQGGSSAADHVQLFRNHPLVRWQYRVHEQIMPALERLGGRAVATDIVVFHLGYQDAFVVRRKLERNLRLLELDTVDQPDDPFVLFNLGRTQLRLDQVSASIAPLTHSIERLPAGNSFLVQTAYALLIEALCRLGQTTESFRFVQEGRRRFPDNTELLLADGVVRRELGDLSGAEACLVQVLRQDPDNALARHHLAQLRPTSGFFQFNVS